MEVVVVVLLEVLVEVLVEVVVSISVVVMVVVAVLEMAVDQLVELKMVLGGRGVIVENSRKKHVGGFSWNTREHLLLKGESVESRQNVATAIAMVQGVGSEVAIVIATASAETTDAPYFSLGVDAFRECQSW